MFKKGNPNQIYILIFYLFLIFIIAIYAYYFSLPSSRGPASSLALCRALDLEKFNSTCFGFDYNYDGITELLKIAFPIGTTSRQDVINSLDKYRMFSRSLDYGGYRDVYAIKRTFLEYRTWEANFFFDKNENLELIEVISDYW